ncbi:MAG TPA: type I-U CRISPR-associated protein Cas5/Cas6 [Nannocystis exedens]|nr:type I-U CRISPR-associated protein Cas5/Cas6 [Nannocystis exedens]
MSTRALVLRVHLHEASFHGSPEWPPAPGRLFQAGVAGCGYGLDSEVVGALRWLEQQNPPIVAVPRHRLGQEVTFFVPINDLDSKGGDPAQVEKIRAAKTVRPRLLTGNTPIVYIWPEVHNVPAGLAEVVGGLYQLGRGLDPAWATHEIIATEEVNKLLAAWPGEVYRPTPGASSGGLRCPRRGTLDSLVRRHNAQGMRFSPEIRGKNVGLVFTQPPKALLREVSYNAIPARFIFELRSSVDSLRFEPWPLTDAHGCIRRIRDLAVARLSAAIDRKDDIQGVLIGRRPGEPVWVRKALRARLIPLPSIGHVHTDPAIRRVLFEVPQGGPLSPLDLRWALSGLEIDGRVLVDTQDTKMLAHYTQAGRRWQSVTPIALPILRRSGSRAKGSSERMLEESRARAAVRQALRHAGFCAQVLRVEVQREPLLPVGAAANEFEAGRFTSARLWHVEIQFADQVKGPIVLGDGRFLGLGLMRPVNARPVIRVWRIVSGLSADDPDPLLLAKSLRRAVMSRCQDRFRRLPSWISGHQDDGSPARGNRHLEFSVDLPRRRLLVLDPMACSRRADEFGRYEAALSGFTELRAGPAGRLELIPEDLQPQDPLVAPAMKWQSITPYQVDRHVRAGSPRAAIEFDLRRSLLRCGQPEPTQVDVHEVAVGPDGLSGLASVTFARAVEGPLLLGRSKHRGGGLFAGSGPASGT